MFCQKYFSNVGRNGRWRPNTTYTYQRVLWRDLTASTRDVLCIQTNFRVGEGNEFLKTEKKKNASSEKMFLQHRGLAIYSEHEVKVGIKSVLSLTFWNHRLVLFLNRDAISDLINVALAVPLACHIPDHLHFFF